MPLIPCPECSKIVSDQAFICPHCGYPLHPQFQNALVKSVKAVGQIAKNIFIFIFSFIVLILSIGLLMYVVLKAYDFFSRGYLK